MNRSHQFGALTLMLAVVSYLSAQTAPKSPQLAAAKTVFISNDTQASGTQSDDAYNTFYAAVQKLNRFTIVTSPSQADLILEFGLAGPRGYPGVGGFYETLRIIDPRSQIVLWSVSESDQEAGRKATIAKNTQNAMDTLAADLQRVCTASATN